MSGVMLRSVRTPGPQITDKIENCDKSEVVSKCQSG